MFLRLQFFYQIINQLFCLFPSKTRVCNRLAKCMLSHPLGTVFNITFNHQSLYKTFDICILISASRSSFTFIMRSVNGNSFFTSIGIGSFLWKCICIIKSFFLSSFLYSISTSAPSLLISVKNPG